MKMARSMSSMVLFAAAVGFAGCGPPGKVQEETIEVKEPKALEQAREMLQNYAKGQPLGSEVTTFPYLIEEVKKEDAARGAVLEKGLKELEQTKGAATKNKAKEILGELAPKQRLD